MQALETYHMAGQTEQFVYLDTFLPMPPSTNNLYYTDKRTFRRIPTPGVQAYKTTAVTDIRYKYQHQVGGFWIPNAPARLIANYTFYFPDYKIAGRDTFKMRDIDNLIKLIQDSIFAAAQDDHYGYEPDDSQICYMQIGKIRLTEYEQERLQRADPRHPHVHEKSKGYKRGYAHAQLTLLNWGGDEGGRPQYPHGY
jgi:Holliday junction resolvase RusA-like endonuclease